MRFLPAVYDKLGTEEKFLLAQSLANPILAKVAREHVNTISLAMSALDEDDVDFLKKYRGFRRDKEVWEIIVHLVDESRKHIDLMPTDV